MNKRKKISLIISCILFFVILFRELGLLDINAYLSKISSSKTASISLTNTEKQFSYRLIIKYGNQDVYHQSYNYNNFTPIEIVAIIEEPKYSGKYFTPFVKCFKMTYLCNFSTLSSQVPENIKGKIEGEVNANFEGFCSCRNAKKLAFEEALKSVRSYLEKKIGNRT